MVVSFGLNGASGFRDELVRALEIYPTPGAFTVENITTAWGKPEAIGTHQETGQVMFRYDAQGLLVVMNRRGDSVEVMLFVPTPAPEKR
jgi:YD repeat-containing protein